MKCYDDAMRAWIVALVLLTACSSDPRTTLVVYSPHGKELLGEFEKRFEASYPHVDVRWLDMGSQDALDRIRSEKANPQADVWWGAPSTMFAQAEKEGLLEPYKPSWAEHIDADARSRNDFWYGTFQTPEVIAYNSDAVSAQEAPKDWDELLDPKWKNKIIIRDPLASGTMRAIYSAAILRAMGPDGSPEPGYEWLKKLDANTKEYVINQTLLMQKLGRREGLVTLWNMPDIELQQTQYGFPLGYVIPRSGTPVLTDAIAIVKGTERRKEAEAFYEFVNSADSLVFAAHRFFRIPSRNDIPRERLPEWMRDLNIPKMDMNWDLVEKKSEEWMEYWDAHIRGAGGL